MLVDDDGKASSQPTSRSPAVLHTTWNPKKLQIKKNNLFHKISESSFNNPFP